MKEEKLLRKKVGSDSGFKVPDSYFETFEDRMSMRLSAIEGKEKHPKRIIQMFQPVLALAACFVLVVLLFKYPAQQLTQSVAKIEVDQEVDMIELAVSSYVGDTYLVDLVMQGEVSLDEMDDEDVEIMIGEITSYVSDLDLISGIEVD
ncbi:MAG: hypothetical protein ACK5IJ_06890 [Mangrovibacterium sp.]